MEKIEIEAKQHYFTIDQWKKVKEKERNCKGKFWEKKQKALERDF